MKIDGVDMDQLVLAGASPRGMSMLLKAAKVKAWLKNRDALYPEDIRHVFHDVIGHRIFFTPVYEMRRESLAKALTQGILEQVATP